MTFGAASARSGSGPLPRVIDRTSLWLGAVLLMASLPRSLWHRGLQPPAALVAAFAVAELGIFQFIDRPPALLVLIASASVLGATYRAEGAQKTTATSRCPRTGDRRLGPTPIRQHLTTDVLPAAAPTPGLTIGAYREHCLRWRQRTPLLYRIGADARTRTSPLGIAVFITPKSAVASSHHRSA
ncbi:MAG: hypothetical protein R3D67_02170 [Hyphomicrobiaceae bacterium]